MKRRKSLYRYIKQILCSILSVLMILTGSGMTAYAKPEWPCDTGIESEAGIVMDMDSKTVLFGQNIHVKKAPASITKLLTALVVVENSDLSDMVTFSHEAIYDVESGSGNKMGMEEGDRLSVEDCLYLLLLQSSNQAANALAEHVAGNRAAFVDMMNDKAKELGCKDSHFANPSGLNDDTQLTTAYDMALIGIEAYGNPKLLEIGSAKKYKIPATKNNPDGRSFAMEHKLLITTDTHNENYYPYAVAGKTGYTSIAGQTLVTYAKKDGRRLIAVTLKSKQITHYKDTIALFGFGFKNFKNVKIAENETVYTSGTDQVPIGEKKYNPSDLSIDKNAVVTLPSSASFSDVEKKVETDLTGDHPKGAVARLSYTYDDRNIGSVYLISGDEALKQESEAAANMEPSGSQEDKKEKPKSPGKANLNPLSLVSTPIISGVLIAAAVILLSGLVVFAYKKKKEKERRLLEERRQRRMKRLEEIGCSQDEFRRLLEARTKQKRD